MKNRHWIQGGFCCESPLFRREFWAEGVKSARLEICGLGFFRLYVNGKRVGDEEFLPAWTNFSSLLGCRAAYPVWEERANYRTGKRLLPPDPPQSRRGFYLRLSQTPV